MHRGKDWIETFVEDIVNEVKWYDEVWNISTTTIGTAEVIKRDHKATEKCHIYFKEFNDSENR